MAKRTRGSNRPGHRRPERHAPARPQPRPAARPASALSDDEEDRAAELESQIVAQDRARESALARSRAQAAKSSRDIDARRPARQGGQSLLAVRAAEEYGYVVRDVRRILTVVAGLVVIFVALFVMIDVLKVISIV